MHEDFRGKLKLSGEANLLQDSHNCFLGSALTSMWTSL